MRKGTSYIEVQVAFAMFGIGLAGIGPLVVTQMKQVRQIEQRFSADNTYYLIPSNDPWARKLGVAATIQTVDATPSPPAPGSPVNDVTVLSLTETLDSETVTANVLVEAIPVP